MSINVLYNRDVSYLNFLLINHKLKIMPASFYETIPQSDLSLWCHKNGIYCLPTEELIDFLKNEIGTSKTIEIGSGNGAIGRALKIPMTDSKNMELPEVKEHYLALNQPVTIYPNDVEKLDAMKAVKKYNPVTVIGAWVTHRYNHNDHLREGSIYGIDENLILKKVKKYIVIGNVLIHSKKPIMKYKHETLISSWLYSRSMFPEGNRVYIWDTDKI